MPLHDEPAATHVSLSPPLAVPRSQDVSAVALRREKKCLWFYRKWLSFSQVPKRFEICLLLAVLKWKISNSSLCIKKKNPRKDSDPSIQQTSATEGELENLSSAIRAPSLKGEGAVVPRSDMQTDPRPRLPGRSPSDNDKPTCGGVLPVFLSVGFHGALKTKKKAFYGK